MRLIADTRERKIHPFFKEADISFEITQIYIGDYAILDDNNQIVICFERKTWSDLASSICDGRMENIGKLKALREKTGCKLYIILEGGFPVDPKNKIFQKISFESAVKFLRRITYVNDIFIIQTKDPSDTVQTLNDFCEIAKKYNNDENKYNTPIPILCKESIINAQSDIESLTSPIIDKFTKNLSDARKKELIGKLWNSLPGFSKQTGENLGKHFSFADIFDDEISVKMITDRFYQNHLRRLSVKARTTLQELMNGRFDHLILCNLPGIGSITANKILEQNNNKLKDFLSAEQTSARENNIKDILFWRIPN
nr:hypothetical protein [Abalone asfa-like virus]